MSRRRLQWICCTSGLTLAAALAQAASPKHVIFMIGDGMGPNHAAAAGMYLNGSAGTLCFESLPYQAEVRTYSASSSVTDSAAAATAMATGHKVNNGVISRAYPGNGAELQTLLEVYKSRGARTGLVTSDGMTGATPAGFGAHEADRSNTSGIAGDYLNQTRPNILLGGGGGGLSTSAAAAAGYTVVTDRAAMQAIDTGLVTMLSGQFGSGSMPYEYDGVGNLPHLSQMLITALDILDNDPDGFFLMVESGNIDHAGHANDIARDVFDTVEFHNTVQVALDWAAGRTDTLVLVTADHETGGLSVVQNNGQGNLPTVSWSTTGHTGVNVKAWASGVNAEFVTGTMENTDLFGIVVGRDPAIRVAPAAFSKTVTWRRNLPDGVDSFTVSNGGLGSFAYTISSDASWVWPTPASGTCTSEVDTIWLSYDTPALDLGTYVAHLEVSSDEATNSPQTVTVSLTVAPVFGDFDADRDVDQEDYGHLQACFAPAATIAGCEDADANHDNQVNLTDFAVFNRCFSGPNVSPAADCAD